MGLKSDFLEVVQAVLNPCEYGAIGAVVIDDCQKKISEFSRATIVHCNREVNVAVHELARFSFRERLQGAWFDEPPEFLIPLIVEDMIEIE
jgi:hypothetical protein